MCVGGEQSEISPIWFVLQSQIKGESGEGEIASAAVGWQHARSNRHHREARNSLHAPKLSESPPSKKTTPHPKKKVSAAEDEVSAPHSAAISQSCCMRKKKEKPMGRVPSGRRVMTNIEGTLGLDDMCVCVCVYPNMCVCVWPSNP